MYVSPRRLRRDTSVICAWSGSVTNAMCRLTSKLCMREKSASIAVYVGWASMPRLNSPSTSRLSMRRKGVSTVNCVERATTPSLKSEGTRRESMLKRNKRPSILKLGVGYCSGPPSTPPGFGWLGMRDYDCKGWATTPTIWDDIYCSVCVRQTTPSSHMNNLPIEKLGAHHVQTRKACVFFQKQIIECEFWISK